MSTPVSFHVCPHPASRIDMFSSLDVYQRGRGASTQSQRSAISVNDADVDADADVPSSLPVPPLTPSLQAGLRDVPNGAFTKPPVFTVPNGTDGYVWWIRGHDRD